MFNGIAFDLIKIIRSLKASQNDCQILIFVKAVYPSKPTRRQRPKAVGGASERSERGRSALFKNPLFFLRDAILRQHKILLRRDNFCPRLGTKNFPN